jgi:hypothetical protein
MKKHHWSFKRSALWAFVPLILAGCAEEQAAIKPQALSAVGAVTSPVAANERDAKKILMSMAEFLAKTPRFSVNLTGSYEVLQDTGQKIEFGENRRILVSRPNGLRVEVEHSDGEEHLVLYDGKEITTFSPKENVYAQVSKPGGIDEAITYFLKDLHMRLPLAALLLSRFPAEIERRTQSLDYVEQSVMQGRTVHHLAGRTATVDYQIWIPAETQPLPFRVVLTYKNAEGQPSFRAQFSDWNLAPEISDNQFAFKPPEGVHKIAFLAQLPNIELEEAQNPEQSGEQK